MVGINKLWSVNLVGWFPGVVCFWVFYPLDEIVKGSSPTSVPMINDPLDFIFFFPFDKVRRWPRVVGPVCVCFTIGG